MHLQAIPGGCLQDVVYIGRPIGPERGRNLLKVLLKSRRHDDLQNSRRLITRIPEGMRDATRLKDIAADRCANQFFTDQECDRM